MYSMRSVRRRFAEIRRVRRPSSCATLYARTSRGGAHGSAGTLRSVADRLLNVACAMFRDGTCFDRHRARTATA